MGVGRVVEQLLSRGIGLTEGLEKFNCSRVEAIDRPERVALHVAWGRLQERCLMDHAILLQERAPLQQQGRVGDVVRRLDVLDQRLLEVVCGLVDGLGHGPPWTCQSVAL